MRANAIRMPLIARNLQHSVCLSLVFLREAISFAVAITGFWHSLLSESHKTVCLHYAVLCCGVLILHVTCHGWCAQARANWIVVKLL